MTARVPTKVVLYDYASGSERPAAEFHWSEEDGVTLQIIEPEWGKLAQRYFTEGVYLSTEQRVVLPSDGEAFMRALVQPTRSTYSALVDESGPSLASMPVAADTGGFTPDEAYRHLAGMPIRPGPDEPPPPEPEVVPLPARTRDEAQLFMDLHPCERCGSVRTPWDSGLTFVGGEPARRYFGACGTCGRERSFLFRSPDPRELPPATGLVTFGGPAPSTLIDAGEWLWVADLTASRVPANDPAGARYALSIATAALEEILKFIPDGAARVPDEGFWSARGREMRAAEPARFDRELVELIRDAYREKLAQVPDPGQARG